MSNILFVVYDQHRMFGESCYRLMAKNGQFIYMRTRGRLDVDQDSRACTSFVCTNTVVDEKEGKHLIKLMRKKFTLMVNNSEAPAIEEVEDEIKDVIILVILKCNVFLVHSVIFELRSIISLVF